MKVKGTSNPADLMTKHLGREQVEQHVEALNMDFREGHADTAVKLHSAQQRRWGTHTRQRRQQHRQQAEPNNDNDNDGHVERGQDSRSSSVGYLGAGPERRQWGAAPSSEIPNRRDARDPTVTAHGALSRARESLRSAPEGAASRRPRDAERLKRKPGWQVRRPGLVTARFKGARAYRSPCSAGIPWEHVVYRETRDSQSGEVLEALYPRQHGTTAKGASQLLGSVTDLEVEVHYDCDVQELAPRSVRWADLSDTDAEEETPAETCGGGVGANYSPARPKGPAVAGEPRGRTVLWLRSRAGRLRLRASREDANL